MIRPRNLSGKSKTHVWLQQLLRYVDAIAPIDSGDIAQTRTPRGTSLQIKRNASGSNRTVQRFKITSVDDNWLVCRKVNKNESETSDTDFKVMRPEKLRSDQALPSDYKDASLSETDSQNRTFDRTIEGTDYTVSQEIYPPYAAGDFIYGTDQITGGTEDDGTGTELEWIDLNIDGRHWQYSMREIEVCVDNAVKKAIAQISEGED